MKCDRCGKNEATFHYKTNINGRVTEAHLCPDCARAMGYAGSVERRMSSWFDDDWFDRPFRMLEPFFGGFGSRMLTEFPQPVDVLEQAQSADPENSAAEELLPKALETQLHNAVAEERYEDAARLRDELKALGGKAS